MHYLVGSGCSEPAPFLFSRADPGSPEICVEAKRASSVGRQTRGKIKMCFGQPQQRRLEKKSDQISAARRVSGFSFKPAALGIPVAAQLGSSPSRRVSFTAALRLLSWSWQRRRRRLSVDGFRSPFMLLRTELARDTRADSEVSVMLLLHRSRPPRSTACRSAHPRVG